MAAVRLPPTNRDPALITGTVWRPGRMSVVMSAMSAREPRKLARTAVTVRAPFKG